MLGGIGNGGMPGIGIGGIPRPPARAKFVRSRFRSFTVRLRNEYLRSGPPGIGNGGMPLPPAAVHVH